MTKPKALIVGANGFLGTYSVRAARDTFDVIPGGRTAMQPGSVAIDVTDPSSVDRAFEVTRPDAVLLLAAISDIDRCEMQPEQAFAVNVRGAELVAKACARINARLVFTSTGAVFDGYKHGYREEDAVSPLSVYGKTKVEAEEVVRASVPGAVVVRLSLVLGFARKVGTNSMLDTLHANWKAGKSVAFPTFEFRNPIHASWVSEVMVRLMADHQISGIYNAGASDSLSRYEIAKRLAVRAGFSDRLVQPQAESVPGRAPRGRDYFLLPEKLEKVCSIKSPTCDQVIERCFDAVA